MDHGNVDEVAQLKHASDIPGRHDIWAGEPDMVGFAFAETCRDVALDDVVRSRRSAAQMIFLDAADSKPGLAQ